ncbi:MAG: TonB-dependent receptor domain-containing protein [Gemmatimonadota bacterium]
MSPRRGSILRAVCSLALAAALPFTARPAFAQQTGTITGRVVAAATLEPLSGANVAVIGTVRGALASDEGRYALTMGPGTYAVRASLIGYEPVERRVTVVAGESVTADFELQEAVIAGQELVVIGSRTARTAIETPVPIDVITAQQIVESGHTEVNQILREIVPSFNASHQTISDGTDHVNPASLRGLGPDQTLVLINGKRRHPSALVHVNGTFGRGTVGVDLNAIPTSAIERIEVLRDGASAQYGSDAIAGVINIVLKEQTQKLQLNGIVGATGGCLSQPDRADTGEPINLDWDCDGEQGQVGVNYGFPIGEGGFFNITGQYLNRQRTNRSGAEERDFFLGISGEAATDAELARRGLTRADLSMKTGQGKAVVGSAFYNTAFPIAENAELYSFGGLTFRDGIATGFYRRPNQEERVVPELFPNGFLPEINTDIDDGSISVGLRGTQAGWDVDLSVTHGASSFLFNIENTNNASMGVSSPTTFDAGTLKSRQTTGNFDAVRLLDTKGALKSFSLVLGGEFRVENYEIEAGEFGSFSLGNGGDVPGVDFDTTSSGQPKAAGSQVFPGFQPSNEVDRSRNSVSAYAGLETEVTDQFLIDFGGRFENYSDFGSRVTGKLALRAEVTPGFALRGAVSSGFRAPSLQQIWFNNVSTQFLTDPVTGEQVPKRVLTANNLSGVARAFGVPPLDEETSINVSAGFTARPTSSFSLTADIYFIEIDDRIVLSSRFASGSSGLGLEVGDILEPFSALGVTQAQFFANAVDTETFGVDIVASYGTRLGEGQLNLTAAANFTDTDVTSINVPQSIADRFTGGVLEDVESTLFNREERNRLEDALPRQKVSLTARYTLNRFTGLGRFTYYGNVKYKPTKEDNDETFDPKGLVDLELGYEIVRGVRWSIGAQNLFNTYPDQHEKPSNRDGERFIFSRRVTQFGSNGGFYFTRLRLNL